MPNLGSDGLAVDTASCQGEEPRDGDGADVAYDGAGALMASFTRLVNLLVADRNEASSGAKSDAWQRILGDACAVAYEANSRRVSVMGEGSLDAGDSVADEGAPQSVRRQSSLKGDDERRRVPVGYQKVSDGAFESPA